MNRRRIDMADPKKEFTEGTTWSDGNGLLTITAPPDEKGFASYTRTGKFQVDSPYGKKLKPFKRKD
jgi:hypothetical protein